MRSLGATALLPLALPLRDDRWLEQLLDLIWTNHFSDTPRLNHVHVSFGAAWKSRLGLITMSEDEETTYIQVNALLRLAEVPEYVAKITVAHEMVHYAHGFGSPLPRRYKHPHRGGIVRRELVNRGLALEYELYDTWVYTHWYDMYAARVEAGAQPADPIRRGEAALELPPNQ